MRNQPAVENPAKQSSAITVHIPAPLRECCQGASEIALSSFPDVRALLRELESRYPSLYRSICDETGAVRRHINVFVNINNIRDRNGVETALGPGDVVTIMTAVSGG